MKLNRVLIVAKQSDGTKPFDHAQAQAISIVKSALKKYGAHIRICSHKQITRSLDADMIVSIGGDGTFLAAAHGAGKIPVLGLNSEPARSVGFFCATKTETFAEIINRIFEKKIRPRLLPLIETKIDGRVLPCLALNDVLFAGLSPAETVRYKIFLGKKHELQKSSGIWISAGPGSTAAIHSAGGKRMPIASKRLQYIVRELCPTPSADYRLKRGILPAEMEISILSEMKHGAVYLDGHWHSYKVPRGSKVTCKIAKQNLAVFL